MIIVLFPAGAFGSTIEYSLRAFSNELTKVDAQVKEDGSMHSFSKEWHPTTIERFLKNKDFTQEIATPTYPGQDYLTPGETVKQLQNFITKNEKVILIMMNSVEMAERNQLFAYYKAPDFMPVVMENKEKSWNSEYKSYLDMQPFELREALSFYIDTQTSYLEIKKDAVKNWLYITPDDILYDFQNTIIRLMEHCNLTINQSASIDTFYQNWFEKQQYVLKEFETINMIVKSITLGRYFKWEKISILGEAIIQSRLRKQGLEIACYNLNVFPTDTTELIQVII